ncbi:hypothetical protein ACR73I_10570 [Bifidobacterium pseudocatenulatum]|uniref:hypothetical protein n=1 Tax=Bifidobacterium pseudocatenulatum TaxID=28026 RepID=UPI003DA32B97
MAETGGVPLNASPVRRWAGVFGHRPFAFRTTAARRAAEWIQRADANQSKAKRKETKKRTRRKRINTQPKAIHKNKARQHRQKNKPYPQPKQKTKNYTHQKETTRVLHPASRLTPENGGIPPFYGCC